MKRALFAVVVLCCGLVSPVGHAAGTQQDSYRWMDIYQSFGPAYVHVMAGSYTSGPVGGPPTTSSTYACVEFNNGFGFDAGCGPVAVSLDPLVLSGSMTGSIPSNQGTITLNLSFAGTHVSSNPPYVDLELLPSVPASARLTAQVGRQGRSSGTVASSALGSLTLSSAQTSAFSQEYVSVSA